MQSVYIIGGYGTLAGIDICKKLIHEYTKLVKINGDNDNINFILDSHTFSNGNNDTLSDCSINLNNSFERIRHYGLLHNVNNIIVGIGCNTMHMCLNDIYKSLPNLIIVNMIQCVIKHVKHINITNLKVVLWSTKCTYDCGLYKDIVTEENNLDVFNLLTELYLKLKKNDMNVDKICDSLVRTLPKKCILILGCTELPLIKNRLKVSDDTIIVDSNEILAINLAKMYLKNA